MSGIELKTLIDSLDDMEFHQLATIASANVGVFRAPGGTSPWEMHPHDDEVLMVLEGRVELSWLTEDGEHKTMLSAGSAVVVPKGRWHRHRSEVAWKELYISPEVTLHSTSSDPRNDA